VSARKTERLLNLVICLLATRRHLTAEQIRRAVPQYDDCASDEAFRRMFERDKEELRDLGIPLETGSDSVWDDEPGYRIARGDYELQDIALEADEAAAIGLAARLWQTAVLSEPASRAVLKLQAAGIETDGRVSGALEPRVEATEDAFAPLLAAVRAGQAVRFPYRPVGAAAAAERHVEPWGIVSWRGRWYAVGHDRDRGATRVFRLSRVTGDVRPVGAEGAVVPPADVDLVREVAGIAHEEPAATARLRVRAGRAADLRRNAQQESSAEGWDVVTHDYADADRFAEWIAGYGADVVVLEPAEVRDAVIRRLRAAAGAV